MGSEQSACREYFVTTSGQRKVHRRPRPGVHLNLNPEGETSNEMNHRLPEKLFIDSDQGVWPPPHCPGEPRAGSDNSSCGLPGPARLDPERSPGKNRRTLINASAVRTPPRQAPLGH